MNAELGLSRRYFIGAVLAMGGSVFFYGGVHDQRAAASSQAELLLNGWIRIAPNGAVTVFSRTTELGQGALTSLALIVAEELQIDPAEVAVEMAPVTDQFMDHANALGYGIGTRYYVTWGSLSSRDMDRSMRKIAATVRVLLLRAAAQNWHVAETECSAEDGFVRHSDGRTLSYAALAPQAAS
jgi:isoquinoline 1-oxidoreductase beta subunit